MTNKNIDNKKSLMHSENRFEVRRYASRMSSKFKLQLDKFEERCSIVPQGWQHLIQDAVRMLRAVDCPKRDGIEFSEPEITFGQFYVKVYFGPTDKAVRAIINKLIKKTACTCHICGSTVGTIYRQDSNQTLCASCYVRTNLYAELEKLLETKPVSNLYRSRPLFAFNRLPKNIQLVIPKEKIKTLYLSAEDKPIKYVTPADIQTQSKKLALMMRYLNQAGVQHY